MNYFDFLNFLQATIVVNIHKRSALSPPPARRVVTQSVEVSRDAARLARVRYYLGCRFGKAQQSHSLHSLILFFTVS